ncbi:hypothetical protein AB1046_18690 [Promicromonospora sp. Populi]|uniref:hypothetical protein n=1 Tax=Promicromonospora sp. Populi TaxID=3239420 RepID=UPI0034E30023
MRRDRPAEAGSHDQYAHTSPEEEGGTSHDPLGARPPVALAGFTLLAGSLVFLSYELGAEAGLFPAPVAVAVTVLALVTAGFVIVRQSRRTGWTERHQLAVLTGALLTYCWAGFLVQASQYGLHPVGVAIQVALVLGALALLWVARRRVSAVRRRDA